MICTGGGKSRDLFAKLPKWYVRYWPVYSVTFGVWITGVSWLVFHYFFLRYTDFGPTHHPLEHWSIVLHGAFAFFSTWLMGYLWATHVSTRWRLQRHRKTGGALFTLMMTLILTGYLLYYLSSDELRDITSVVHWVVGLALPVFFLGHWLIRASK